jgi:hypothetical protein
MNGIRYRAFIFSLLEIDFIKAAQPDVKLMRDVSLHSTGVNRSSIQLIEPPRVVE